MTAMANDAQVRTAPETLASNILKGKTCDDVGAAVDTGKVGDIVAKHEKLILQYYEDVQDQAKQSFASAKSVARIPLVLQIKLIPIEVRHRTTP
jgi:hypothetical protein